MPTSPTSGGISPAEAFPDEYAWSDRPTEADLKPLPGTPAVFLMVDARGAPVLLATTQHLRRLAISRLTDPERPRQGRADLAEIVRGIRWRSVYSRFEGRWRYFLAARRMHPREYRKLVSFGPAWFLNVDFERPIPEIRTTDRIWRVPGSCLGPWPTHRSCGQALEGLWDLFDLCRYPEQVRKTPRGTRCAYAEMGRCDTPCDGSVGLGGYLERTRAAWRFACGEIEPWMQQRLVAMQRLAGEQEFERAGQIKQQLQFAEMWRRQWSPHVRLDCELSYLLLVPVTRRRAWKPFLFRRGHLSDGDIVRNVQLATRVPLWLTEQLEAAPAASDAVLRMEQTWLAAHFLHHSESKAAIIVSLPGDRLPPGLEERLRREVQERQMTKAPAAESE